METDKRLDDEERKLDLALTDPRKSPGVDGHHSHSERGHAGEMGMGGDEVDHEAEARLLRKLDWHIIPVVMALYLLVCTSPFPCFSVSFQLP